MPKHVVRVGLVYDLVVEAPDQDAVDTYLGIPSEESFRVAENVPLIRTMGPGGELIHTPAVRVEEVVTISYDFEHLGVVQDDEAEARRAAMESGRHPAGKKRP